MVDDELCLFFRQQCLVLQARFAELVNLRHTPRVFLHGNPHLDNYARTEQGEAMIDFDRSRLGPYSWDVLRFLSSASLRREEPAEEFLNPRVVESFTAGYLDAFEHPDAQLHVPTLLHDREPTGAERTMRDYLAANRRWAKRLRAQPIFPSHPTVSALLRLYFEGRMEPEALQRYAVLEAGLADGSMGKPHMLIVLEDRADAAADLTLLDIKQVYSDADTEVFFNPYVHHGMRMIEASYLYAPGMEEMLSYLTWRGVQYWGRKVPCFKAKIEGSLDLKQQTDFAFTVAVQLGRAHRRSLRAIPHSRLVDDYNKSLPSLLAVGAQLNRELEQRFRAHHANEMTPARAVGY